MPFVTPFDVLFCCCRRPADAARERAAPPDNITAISLTMAVLMIATAYAVIISSGPSVHADVSSHDDATADHHHQLPIPFCDDNRSARIKEWLASMETPQINGSMMKNRLHWYDRVSGETLLDWDTTAELLPRVWDRRYVDICLQEGRSGLVVVSGPKTRYTVIAKVYIVGTK